MKVLNMCDYCEYEFAVCKSKDVIFGIDLSVALETTKLNDAVISCDCFLKKGDCMNENKFLKLKEIVRLYEEKTKLVESKETFVQMLNGCISSKYDTAFVKFDGNVSSKKEANFRIKLNDDCLNILIKQTNNEIECLKQELENIKTED